MPRGWRYEFPERAEPLLITENKTFVLELGRDGKLAFVSEIPFFITSTALLACPSAVNSRPRLIMQPL
jgi:hypothetical protein